MRLLVQNVSVGRIHNVLGLMRGCIIIPALMHFNEDQAEHHVQHVQPADQAELLQAWTKVGDIPYS